ncbi:MAG: threonine--tRNA ligase [Gammaproteobacteria bacterium]|nr:threonine--tRNA ligase [Gammaproteobacteria bacterium]
MLTLTLPDGKTRSFDMPLTALEVAKQISPSLAKRSLVARVDDELVDMGYEITQDVRFALFSAETPEGLEVIRHSTAHLLAQAVKRLFPEAQVAIGPVIEDGFYYDFAEVRPFTPEDLEKIEAMMREIVSANFPISRRVLSRVEATQHFQQLGEQFKAKIIEQIPVSDDVTLYQQGEFEDLCRGPHVPSTGALKAFKLLRVAGAYWRGDHTQPMLQRIYGTAWSDKAALDAYLHRMEEAALRDHRKIGKALDLFHFQDIAPGMVFWHPKGWAIYQQLEQYMRNRLRDQNYLEIKTPQLVDKVLWEKSGHWENFRESMFVTQTENRDYAVKPMSCPCHVQVYNAGLKSYRDLPLRYSEFGSCHRCEPSGALHGLMRVRGMVQDDAHIFCTDAQTQAEVVMMLELVQTTYQDFGFDNILYRLALRPEKRVGSDELWDKAEATLKDAMKAKSIEWVNAPGEGAFYGPKIECSLADSIGRIWQCGTIQVDFSMPVRLEAEYVAEDGSRKTPVMLHRAILGSFERFMGILIEHYAGKLPLWLSPVQVMVMPISERQDEFVTFIATQLKKNGIRAEFDLRNEKIGFKIREHTLQRVPYLFVVGAKEVEQQTVSVRTREGEDLGVYSIESMVQALNKAILQRCSLVNVLED